MLRFMIICFGSNPPIRGLCGIFVSPASSRASVARMLRIHPCDTIIISIRYSLFYNVTKLFRKSFVWINFDDVWECVYCSIFDSIDLRRTTTILWGKLIVNSWMISLNHPEIAIFPNFCYLLFCRSLSKHILSFQNRSFLHAIKNSTSLITPFVHVKTIHIRSNCPYNLR